MNDTGRRTTSDPTATPRPAMRALPAVHRVLKALADVALPQPLVLDVVRRHLDALRAAAVNDAGAEIPPEPVIIADIRAALARLGRSRLRPVINATGIIVHTNLGRSPLGAAAVQALVEAAADYTNLEYDVAAGARGARAAYLEQCLALLCGASAATVVNNCAAALLLILRHFASRRPRTHVVISRGELVQIGGGFRVPEILQASGAKLREVGTTNRTTADDYRSAIDDRTAMILKVHRSNFYMDGFVESPTTAELAALAREAGIPLVEDLGSGATFDTATLGGAEHEPTPAETLAAGAELVCFSGDKLLGGPQAGIIAGSAAPVAALKAAPFFRALRCDKLVLSALQATVELLLSGAVADVPVRAMMNVSCDALRLRAQRIVTALRGAGIAASIGSGQAQVGGGSLPRTVLPSVTIDIAADDPQRLAERLRSGEIPVIGFVADARLRLDLRTVFPRQDQNLLAAVAAAVLP
jgi:L-seryl-tRNA(Ser) seleniumtransferase